MRPMIMLPRLFLLSLWLLFCVPTLTATAFAQSETQPEASSEAAAEEGEGEGRAEAEILLEAIESYLNGITHLQGRFTQLDARGEQADGIFYLQRPGRIRFEYLPRGGLLVVADGDWVHMVEQQFEGEAQRYPLAQTPLALLLREEIDLAATADVLQLRREGDRVFLRLRQKGEEAQGDLTLVFEGQDLRLRQWIITDTRGRKTLITLSQLLEGVPVDQRLFSVDTRPARRGSDR